MVRLDFSSNQEEIYNNKITEKVLNGALRQCKNTAAGEDEVHYEMLRHLNEIAQQYLLLTFSIIWQNNTYPARWRPAIILAFPKQNKPQTEAENYRPIALTSCIAKLIKKIVNARLMNNLESGDMLSSYLMDFEK